MHQSPLSYSIHTIKPAIAFSTKHFVDTILMKKGPSVTKRKAGPAFCIPVAGADRCIYRPVRKLSAL